MFIIFFVFQKVSTLPHCRYDQFRELIEDYRDMIEQADIRLPMLNLQEHPGW